MARREELSDTQWAFIDAHLPRPKLREDKKGRPRRADRDKLEVESPCQEIEMTVPHRQNRTKRSTQDARVRSRYCRGRRIERHFARLQNFRRLVDRYEYHGQKFLGFDYLGCILILLGSYFGMVLSQAPYSLMVE
jgi:transposase